MPELTGTTNEKLVKMNIVSSLEKELLSHYDNIVNYSDSISELKTHIQTLSQDYESDPDFDSKFSTFLTNIESYIPTFQNKSDESDNEYLESLKTMLIENYDMLPEDSELLKSLSIDSFDDIANLTELPANYISNITNNIMSDITTIISTDFGSLEFDIGSVLAIAEHNLGIQNITGSIESIMSISETLVENFTEFTDMEAVQEVLNTLPDKLESMNIDTLGNLDVTSILEDSGISSPIDIQNITNSKDAMNSVVGTVTGNVSQSVGGGGGACACNVSFGQFNSPKGKIQSLGQPLLGKLKSALTSFLKNFSISNFPSLTQMKDSIKNQIEQYKQTTSTSGSKWSDINKT